VGGAGRASPANTATAAASPAVATLPAPLAEGAPSPLTLEERQAQLNVAFAPWAHSLSEEESLALLTYTGSGHERINARLRAREGLSLEAVDPWDPPSPVAREALMSTIRRLDAVISRGQVPTTLTVYRGRERHVPLAEAQQRIGGIARDYGFVSTSLALHVAALVAGYQKTWLAADPSTVQVRCGTLYEITIPAGSRAAWVDIHEDRKEYELLLPRGSRFRVTGVRQEPWAGEPPAAYTVIQMELLPPGRRRHE